MPEPARRESEELLELPLREAVTVAVCAEGICPATTSTVADEAPAGTVTEAGKVTSEVLAVIATTVAPGLEGPLRVMVQVA